MSFPLYPMVKIWGLNPSNTIRQGVRGFYLKLSKNELAWLQLSHTPVPLYFWTGGKLKGKNTCVMSEP